MPVKEWNFRQKKLWSVSAPGADMNAPSDRVRREKATFPAKPVGTPGWAVSAR
jgi:hypothetical protein